MAVEITITTEQVLAAAAYSAAHPETYDQAEWCGTACCVAGRCRAMLGLPAARGPLAEYTTPGPRAHMLRAMMGWSHRDTAALMPHVGEDGVLCVPVRGIGAFGAGADIGEDVVIRARAVLGEDAVIREGVVVGEGVVIRARAVVRATD